jgi:hypothetical protein
MEPRMSEATPKSKAELQQAGIDPGLYFESQTAAIDVQIEASFKLRKLELKTGDLGGRSGYRADRLRIEADIALLERKLHAFNEQNARIFPPDPSDVNAIRKLLSTVAELTIARNNAASLTKIATDAMNKLAAIQPDG